jgi:hypothetical protein
MDARPLKDVFADLVGDPSAGADALAAAGYDLPADLVAEAVVSFAGTAPAEVAEHLAPFVTANSGVPTDDAGTDDWFELLATAPDPTAPDLDMGEDLDDGAVLDAVPAAHAGIGEFEFGAGADADGDAGTDLDAVTDDDLDTDPDDFDDSAVGATDDPADEPALEIVGDLSGDLDDADDDASDDADDADLDG